VQAPASVGRWANYGKSQGIDILKHMSFLTTRDPIEISWTSDAGNERLGWFCRDCGGRIANGQAAGLPVLTLRSGTLDDKSWVNPVADFWTKSAQPWVEFSSGRPSFEYEPTDFQPLLEAFHAQGHFLQ
jgi:hypothetical protein